ncbi:hypothetical protein ALC56_11733 [Trachymyrmex septentrionalis]|uniref:Uncharacterized protein n=1 Tax=Trachymyrmex septentrionalis TaxID=34720 RepID=A0A195F1E1_9HYME|nr:hypothetical protein ALC56_11733 [Trachymyrmex septentrionalis]
MLAEKVAGVWWGNREHLPRSDRENLFKWFESADLTRLWRIYARSIDERVKDWRAVIILSCCYLQLSQPILWSNFITTHDTYHQNGKSLEVIINN